MLIFFTAVIFVCFLVLIIVITSFLTFQRNRVWQNDFDLWSDVVTKSPNKYRGYFNLGVAYLDRGDYQNALKNYVQAIKLKPDYVKAYNNIAAIYTERSKYEEAEKIYKVALEIDPMNSVLRKNLTDLYL